MTGSLARLFVDPLVGAYGRVAGALPSLAAALLLLLVGMFGARLARVSVETVLGRLRLDEHTGRVGLNEVLARLGLGKSPTEIAAFSAFWFVLVVFIVSAANAADITAVSALLERFVLFLPSLVAAVVTLFGGLLFARLVNAILQNAAAANSVRGGVAVARGAYAVVVLFSAVAALEQVGVNPALTASAVTILFASVGLALGLAFGLGAKDLAGDALRALLARKP
ncbi:MAG: hypothetical protein SF051_10095 [Elusimicrobiota bacterium]|nr:hypothetical protein [Elusimicrobiota bacterium]